jgi:hypothetical protein
MRNRWQVERLDTPAQTQSATTDRKPTEGDAVSPTPDPLPQVALALFAEAVADPAKRRKAAHDPLELMKEALIAHGHDFDQLEPDVQHAFISLFSDLSYGELRILGRLQAKLVEADPDHKLGLTELVEVGSHATLAKL